MVATEIRSLNNSWLDAILSDERFWPAPPQTLAETGLPISLVESLVCKHLAVTGTASGRSVERTLSTVSCTE